MSLTTDSFTYVADLVRKRSAINLPAGKEYLVESRLLPLARRAGLSVDEYVTTQRRAASPLETELIVEALTTNETSWFRDVQPFQALANHMIPDLLGRNAFTRSIRVWSGACSTGQEPYSIAMTLKDCLPVGPRAEIVATDLSNEVLEKARAGVYSQLEVNRGLPAKNLVEHFVRQGPNWAISQELRSMIAFQKHNLLNAPPLGGPFDIIFLRNVLIYFEMDVKRDIMRRLRSVLRPGGYLVLGAAETTVGVDSAWSRVQVGRSSIYQLTTGSGA